MGKAVMPADIKPAQSEGGVRWHDVNTTVMLHIHSGQSVAVQRQAFAKGMFPAAGRHIAAGFWPHSF